MTSENNTPGTPGNANNAPLHPETFAAQNPLPPTEANQTPDSTSPSPSEGDKAPYAEHSVDKGQEPSAAGEHTDETDDIAPSRLTTSRALASAGIIAAMSIAGPVPAERVASTPITPETTSIEYASTTHFTEGEAKDLKAMAEQHMKNLQGNGGNAINDAMEEISKTPVNEMTTWQTKPYTLAGNMEKGGPTSIELGQTDPRDGSESATTGNLEKPAGKSVEAEGAHEPTPTTEVGNEVFENPLLDPSHIPYEEADTEHYSAYVAGVKAAEKPGEDTAPYPEGTSFYKAYEEGISAAKRFEDDKDSPYPPELPTYRDDRPQPESSTTAPEGGLVEDPFPHDSEIMSPFETGNAIGTIGEGLAETTMDGIYLATENIKKNDKQVKEINEPIDPPSLGVASLDRDPLSPDTAGLGDAGQERDGKGLTAVERGDGIAEIGDPLGSVVTEAVEDAVDEIDGTNQKLEDIQNAMENSEIGENVK